MAEVWKKSKQKGAALLVQLALADFADDEGFCFPSMRTIARKARLSLRQAHRVVADLKKAGELTVHGAGPHGTNRFKVEICAGVTSCQGDTGDTSGMTRASSPGVPRMSPDPSEDPSKNHQRITKSRSTKKRIQNWYDTQFLPKYPGPHAHTQRKLALREIGKLTPELFDRVLAILELWKQTAEWRRDGGAWVPGPGTFLENKMHLKAPAMIVAGNANTGAVIPDSRLIIQQQMKTVS